MIQILYYLRLACPTSIFQTCHTGRPLCFGNAIHGDHLVPIPWSIKLYYLILACHMKNLSNLPYKETTVFGKRQAGRPLCSGPMIQNIILPQIGLRQETFFFNAIQEPIVYGKRHARRHCVHRKPQETTANKARKQLVPVWSRLAQRSLFEALPKTMWNTIPDQWLLKFFCQIWISPFWILWAAGLL